MHLEMSTPLCAYLERPDGKPGETYILLFALCMPKDARKARFAPCRLPLAVTNTRFHKEGYTHPIILENSLLPRSGSIRSIFRFLLADHGKQEPQPVQFPF